VSPQVVLWSPDGRWLALAGSDGLAVLDRDTGKELRLASAAEAPRGFSADGTRLLTRGAGRDATLHLRSIPEGKLLETWPPAERQREFLLDRRLLTFTFDAMAPAPRTAVVRERSIDGGPERTLGRWQTRTKDLWHWGLDPAGEWLTSFQNGQLLRQRLDALETPPRVLGRQLKDAWVWTGPWTDRFVTADAAGEVRVWNAITGRVERALKSPASALSVALDPKGRFLATAPGPFEAPDPGAAAVLFDLQAPRAAEPIVLAQKEKDYLNSMAFDPQGRWLATDQGGTVLLWNLAAKRSLVLRGQKGDGMAVAFTPDGRLVSTSGEGVVRAWSLSPEASDPVHVLWSQPGASVGHWVEVDARGRFVVVVDNLNAERVVVVPFDGSPARVHQTPRGHANPVLWMPRIDPSGQYVACSYSDSGFPDVGSIRIVGVATGGERVLRAETTAGVCKGLVATYGAMDFPAWLPDGRLVSDGATGLRVWDLATGSSRQVRPCRPAMEDSWYIVVIRSTPDSRAVVTLVNEGTAAPSDFSVTDLATGASRDIISHGGRVMSFALDATGTTLVTGDADGLVRVGPLSGEGEPHLLYGHSRAVTSVAVSPDGKWIASGSDDGTIRLWPMPVGPPLHTLAYEELLAKLRALTNLRVVAEPASTTGYKLEPGPFPGWANAPEW
jgi:WD40 repeat protein